MKFVNRIRLVMASFAIAAAACAQISNPSQPGNATAGTGLSGAGSVLSVVYGTTANTSLQGNQLHSPTAIGDTTPSTGAFTSLSATTPQALTNSTAVATTAFVSKSTCCVGNVRNLFAKAGGTTSTLAFTADEIDLESALGGQTFKISNFSATLNTGTTGANGLDTGSLSGLGSLAIYAIYNPSTSTAALLGVNVTGIAAPSIYGGANMPSGYTASALISLWPFNGSILNAANQANREVTYSTAIIAPASSSSSVIYATFPNDIPQSAKKVCGLFNVNTATSASIFGFTIFNDPSIAVNSVYFGGVSSTLTSISSYGCFNTFAQSASPNFAYRFLEPGSPSTGGVFTSTSYTF